MTDKETMDAALKYTEILSEIGIKSMIQTANTNLKNKVFDITEVEAGRVYNPCMKDGILLELYS